MIIVDTNVMAYLLLPYKKENVLAQKAFQMDSKWAAPELWRSEFMNVLTVFLRHERISFDDALLTMKEAAAVIGPRECETFPERVLPLVMTSNCSSYDCEFVALAQDLRSPLVTTDKQVLKAFPKIAISLEKFVS